jgi:hypothetical protein
MLRWGLISSVILLAMVAGIWFWATAHRVATAREPTQAVHSARPVAATAATLNASAPYPVLATLTALRERFAKATNYWQFATDVAPAARAGDRDAQYYLWRAMNWCEDSNRFFFERQHRHLTLEEAITEAQRLHNSVQLARLTFARCHDFQDHENSGLGLASEWLAVATESRQPAAQAATAEQLLLQQVMDNVAREQGFTPPAGQEGRINNSVDPHVLLREAVESADPEVLRVIGEVQGMLDPNPKDNTSELAWLLLACRAGLDCSANADWVLTICHWAPSCPTTGGTDEVLEALAAERWQAVQDQAAQIRAQLDGSSWDELGLASP